MFLALLVNWSSHILKRGGLSPVYSNPTRPPGQCTRSPSSSCGLSSQSTEKILQKKEGEHVWRDKNILLKISLQIISWSLPCVVSRWWFCSRSMVWVTSSRAESRLQQRGWSSLGGLMASSFSSSDAELRRAGFLSRARFRKERLERLQSSAMSSRGGACLWICWATEIMVKLALVNWSVRETEKYRDSSRVQVQTEYRKGNTEIQYRWEQELVKQVKF